MFACLQAPLSPEQQETLLQPYPHTLRASVREVLRRLSEHPLAVDQTLPDSAQPPVLHAMQGLARGGLLHFDSAPANAALQLVPASPYFELEPTHSVHTGQLVLSRFFSLQRHGDELRLRNPNALCYLRVCDPGLLPLLGRFTRPANLHRRDLPKALVSQADGLIDLLLRARILLPCDFEGRSEEDRDPLLEQWDAHDLMFHAASRFGRSEKPIGGTFRFKGVLPAQPPVKPNPWKERAIPLPVPDLARLWWQDPPLTQVLESRRSNRSHSPVGLSIDELGGLLYRCLRNRHRYDSAYGEFVSRPYPNGGANYEQEFYLTINQCAGLDRGLYYYDPEAHAVCLVSGPCAEMEALLTDAWHANAMQCRPQVLITIASRFARFNWKYTGMSYAAQLKNVGAIYQTLYLVATAMGLAACGLGTGNADRFSRLTGLAWSEEGSIGEFMIGRAL